MGMATVLGVVKWKLKINGWYVRNVDALNGYFSEWRMVTVNGS